MVSNPFCQPCAQTHKALNTWMYNRDDVKLQILFSTNAGEQSKKTQVAAHLMALKSAKNGPSIKGALDDWYEQKQKNYENWARRYPAIYNNDNIEQLKTHREWCKLANITGTPTIFINGRRLPSPYQPEDIKYLI